MKADQNNIGEHVDDRPTMAHKQTTETKEINANTLRENAT